MAAAVILRLAHPSPHFIFHFACCPPPPTCRCPDLTTRSPLKSVPTILPFPFPYPLLLLPRALLLLESGQATAAQGRVEQYMAAVMGLVNEVQPAEGVDDLVAPGPANHPGHCQQQQQHHCGPSAESPATSPDMDSGILNGDVAVLRNEVGAAAATLRDRAALARLYSQDVLCLGLGRPLEALRWLQPHTAAQSQPHQHHNQQREWRVQLHPSGSQADQAAKPSCGNVLEVVNARELVGGCEETLQRLREELRQLAAISGLALPQGVGDVAAAEGRIDSNGGVGIGNGIARSNGISGAQVVADAAGGVVAASIKPYSHAALPGTSNGAVSAFAASVAAGGGVGCGSDVVNGARKRSASAHHLPGTYVPFPTTLAFMRTILVTVRALVRRLVKSGGLQITRAQTWLLCKAAVVAVRLSELSRGNRSATAARSPWSASLSWVAAAVALAAVVLVAAQAEAPYLRINLERHWKLLMRVLREALQMGLALHPSPVATVGRATH